MKEIMDRIVRPRMRKRLLAKRRGHKKTSLGDDSTVEFGNYVHFEDPLGQGGFGAVYAGYRKTVRSTSSANHCWSAFRMNCLWRSS